MYVYRIINTVNGRAYIGVTTCTLAKRWREHRCAAKTGIEHVLYRAMRKYGEAAFRMECLYEASSVEEMFAVERGLVALHGTRTPRGYNVSEGGVGGFVQEPRRGEQSPNSKLTDEAVRFIRSPERASVCNDDLRALLRERLGLDVSRDCLRDARRGDTWRHMNEECQPVKAQQGTRTGDRHRIAARATMQLPHVRAAAVAASSLRLKSQKIAAKLTPEQARAIFLDTRPNRAIERAYGVAHGVARSIKRGRTWADVTEDLLSV